MQINSGKFQINWNRQWAKRPDLQQCKLPVKKGSRVTWRTILLTMLQTVVGREQSDLINHTICSCTDCCWKGAKRHDRQHYLLSWLGKTPKSLFIFFFFSFLFLFFSLDLQLQSGAWMVMSWVTVTVCHMTRVTWGPWESKYIATVVKCISK